METYGIIKGYVENEIVRFVTLGIPGNGGVVCHPMGHEWRKGVNTESLEEFMRLHADDCAKMDF